MSKKQSLFIFLNIYARGIVKIILLGNLKFTEK